MGVSVCGGGRGTSCDSVVHTPGWLPPFAVFTFSFYAVVDDHCFKDEKLFYRFRRDDGTYQGPPDPPIVAKGQRIYSR